MGNMVQVSNHDHCNHDNNETNILKDKIRHLEAINDQKSAEIAHLK